MKKSPTFLKKITWFFKTFVAFSEYLNFNAKLFRVFTFERLNRNSNNSKRGLQISPRIFWLLEFQFYKCSLNPLNQYLAYASFTTNARKFFTKAYLSELCTYVISVGKNFPYLFYLLKFGYCNFFVLTKSSLTQGQPVESFFIFLGKSFGRMNFRTRHKTQIGIWQNKKTVRKNEWTISIIANYIRICNIRISVYDLFYCDNEI